MVEIPLTNGKVALIDDADLSLISVYRWTATPGRRNVWYAVAYPAHRGSVFMHRLILGTPPGLETDHKNGDGLDNRRENLRPCTTAQNQHNGQPRLGTASRFKGVDYRRRKRCWRAAIQIGGRRIRLGNFLSEIEAARAYNAAAALHFGEFARLNAIQNERLT